MTGWLRDFRLIPIVLVAIGCLFALKTIGLLSGDGYTLGQRLGGSGTLVVTTVPAAPVTQLQSPAVPLEIASAQSPQRSWMQEMFNYPGDITGSIATTKPAERQAMEKAAAAKEATGADKAAPPPEPGPESKAAAGRKIPLDQPRAASAGERALLERLQERRQELDARARELDLRESMLKAAEKKLERQVAVENAEQAKGGGPDAGKGGPAGGPMAERKEDADKARLKGVVSMYEIMKPKDAAKIFDRLDIKVLIELATQIKPQRMSEIMAQMSAEAAEKLTVELASRGADRPVNPSALPKIEGRPSGG
jgi:flagellar motility protein MotE (MotC chaperone)